MHSTQTISEGPRKHKSTRQRIWESGYLLGIANCEHQTIKGGICKFLEQGAVFSAEMKNVRVDRVKTVSKPNAEV